MVGLPAVAEKDAPLPQTYERAKVALSECNQVDECKDWTDKAIALASYAKQANDEELYNLARRIQGRAVRRMGELLEEFKSAGRRTDRVPSGGTPTKSGGQPVTQRQAAASAGLSKEQEVTARRVAAIPQADFDVAIESEKPPTVTDLAERGRRPVATEKPKPRGFYEATHTVAAMRRFSEFCDQHEPQFIIGGLMPAEHAEAKALAKRVRGWLDRFIANLDG